MADTVIVVAPAAPHVFVAVVAVVGDVLNQNPEIDVPPLAEPAWTVKYVALVADTHRLWLTGLDPVIVENDMLFWENCRGPLPLLVTSKTTGSVTGLFAAPGSVMVTPEVHRPAPKFVGSTDTENTFEPGC